MNAQAMLKLNGKDYNIHRMNYKFERDIDVKGRPCSCYYGGSIVVEFESTDDMAVFRNMIDEDMPASSGEILVTTGEDGLILRRLAFSDAYIYAYGEQMNSTSGLPMITTIFISPIRLDVNKNLRLNRRWPEANGWEVMKPEEVKVAQKTVNEQNVKLVDAYWIDKKGQKHFDLFIDRPVTLFVKFEDYTTNKIVNLKFENDDKTLSFEHSGKVGQNGIMEIENFQLKQKSSYE